MNSFAVVQAVRSSDVVALFAVAIVALVAFLMLALVQAGRRRLGFGSGDAQAFLGLAGGAAVATVALGFVLV